MNSNSNQLNEHLSSNDLKWMVDDNILIDMHKTKLGEDKDYIVLSIAVNDRTPAHDLARFIENGVYKFEDVEVSPATDTKGRYLVYIELKRSPEAFAAIEGILKDSHLLSGITEWKFKSLGLNNYVPFNVDAFNQHVVTDPIVYEQQHPVVKNDETEVTESIKSRLKFLLNY